MTPPKAPESASGGSSEFFAAAKTGAIAAAAVLALILPPIGATSLRSPAAKSPAAKTAPGHQETAAVPPSAAAPAALPVRLASFGDAAPTEAVRHIANWTMHSGDHKDMAFIVIDKKDAHAWVFSPTGELRGEAPVLLGAAIGDDSFPGIGDKPLAQVRPEEKTTPAGRFIAEPGVNTNGEDIVWVDYDAAVSMHRVRPVVASERRLERLASPTPEDNRISFGCINMPPAFYNKVLSPAVQQWGAVVYVLPETRTPQALFGSYDVPQAPATQLAGR